MARRGLKVNVVGQADAVGPTSIGWQFFSSAFTTDFVDTMERIFMNQPVPWRPDTDSNNAFVDIRLRPIVENKYAIRSITGKSKGFGPIFVSKGHIRQYIVQR